MKKIMMVLIAIAMTATMNAQVYIGGSFGLGFENKLIDEAGGDDATALTFSIIPEVGFSLSDRSSLGVLLGFGVTNNGNEMGTRFAGYKTDKSAFTFQIAPYYRYKFIRFEKVDLFVDALVGFKYTSWDNWNNTTFNVGIRPGVAFNANEHISFVAKLGNGLFFQSSKDKDVDAKVKFGLSANTLAALEFGMYYTF